MHIPSRKTIQQIVRLSSDNENFINENKDNPLLEMSLIGLDTSKFMEIITVEKSGFIWNYNKHGWDGYKKDDNGNIKYCDAKSKNIYFKDDNSISERHFGYGAINDYNRERYEKDKEENPSILVSGFLHGALLYIISFDFASENFSDYVSNKIDDMLYRKVKRLCVTFSYTKYINDDVELIFLNRNLFKKEYFTKNFYQYLEDLHNDDSR